MLGPRPWGSFCAFNPPVKRIKLSGTNIMMAQLRLDEERNGRDQDPVRQCGIKGYENQ
jgi:hypothetical protein